MVSPRTLVKVNFPQPGKQSGVPEPYRREFSSQDAIDAVVRSANRTLLLVSGGERHPHLAAGERHRLAGQGEGSTKYPS